MKFRNSQLVEKFCISIREDVTPFRRKKKGCQSTYSVENFKHCAGTYTSLYSPIIFNIINDNI